jgi:outer membrane receptor protein involved in Fe transport
MPARRPNHSRRLATRLLALLAAAAPSSHAASAEDEVVMLEALQVSEVPLEQDILPTRRPFDSVFGTEQRITDIPRNVTIISREQLTHIGIRDVRDFSKLTSSSYTRTNFGAPSNPDIRGSTADVFQNGLRERATSNGNGMPLDFNAVESVNIVKGPATAVQGASAYVGGYVDLQTKRPTFDAAKTTLSGTVGSHDIHRWSADVNAPAGERLAYRVSYSGEDSGGYLEDEFRKSHSLYAALSWRPTDTYELFLNASAAYFEYTENWGINRPTQELIDRRLYQTGGPSDAAGVAAVTASGNTVAWGPQVKLDRQSRLLAPGDHSTARNFKLQAIQTVAVDPDTRVVNNNLLTFTRRDTLSSYYYSEIIDPSITLQSRWEYQRRLERLSFNTGLDLKHTRVKAYSDYGFEPAGVWDLSQPRSLVNARASTAFQESIQGGPGFDAALGLGRAPVPGHPGRYHGISTFSSDSNESHGTGVAPFVQGDYRLTDKLTLGAGARVEFLHVRSIEPFSRNEDSAAVALPNLNASLAYKPVPRATLYSTVNYSENTAGAEGNGGGYTLTGLAGPLGNIPTRIDTESYRTPARLYEVGAKFTLLEEKLFLGTALFHQEFSRRPQGSDVTDFVFRGFEIELNYQPNRNFLATFGYSAIDGRASQASFEALSTDIGTVHPELRTAGFATDVRAQGLPKHLFNGLVAYKWDNGFGASLNGTLHSEINNNWAGTVVIPWQYELNASLFYVARRWELRATVFNLTDEWNWAPNNGVYGNESILLQPGLRGELTFALRF